ncbi:MAG: hypothetical protein HY902_14415, partial [Deltaproteobacteria bacterium]|nr:hypothetical protein [Deltaproteobacteria bacterium]
MAISKRKWMWGGAAAIAVSLAAYAVLLTRVEPWVRQAVDRRLAGSGFAVEWQGLQVGWLGHVRLTGLQVREGSDTLLEVAEIEASPALTPLIGGRLRLASAAVRQPVAHVDIRDGKPGAWLRLRDALRKPTAEPEGPRRTLADRIGVLHVEQGRVEAKVLGPAVWLAGTDVVTSQIAVELDTASGGSASAVLPDLLGGGKVTAKLQMQ